MGLQKKQVRALLAFEKGAHTFFRQRSFFPQVGQFHPGIVRFGAAEVVRLRFFPDISEPGQRGGSVEGVSENFRKTEHSKTSPTNSECPDGDTTTWFDRSSIAKSRITPVPFVHPRLQRRSHIYGRAGPAGLVWSGVGEGAACKSAAGQRPTRALWTLPRPDRRRKTALGGG